MKNRLIAVEVTHVDMSGVVRELRMFPMDILFEQLPYGGGEFVITMHSTAGDFQFRSNSRDPRFSTPIESEAP